MIRRPTRFILFPSTTLFLFFFNDTATTEIYTLSLHDALPISETEIATGCRNACCSQTGWPTAGGRPRRGIARSRTHHAPVPPGTRSGEHTSELQSHSDLVCRLLL